MGQMDDAALGGKDKRRKRGKTRTNGRWGNGTSFVNVYLTREDKQKIKEVEFDPFDLLVFLSDKVDAGYKVSVKMEADGETVLASIAGVTDECLNKDSIVTARAKSVEKAVLVLIYKVDEILQDDWSLVSDEEEDFME